MLFKKKMPRIASPGIEKSEARDGNRTRQPPVGKCGLVPPWACPRRGKPPPMKVHFQ